MGDVELTGVEVDLGSFKLGPIDLRARDGDYIIVMGPNGSGKSTLLKTIAGLYRPIRGRVIIGGRDVTPKPPEERNVGYVPQGYELFDHMTVFENVEYGLRVRGVPKVERVREVYRIADELGIRGLLNRSVRGLSGGEAQRVALARALVVRPSVLLLDEPLSMIDIEGRDALMLILKEIPRKFNIPVLHVTHNRDEAYSLADRIVVLHGGKVVEEGDPDEVFNRPKSLFTANFVGFKNIFKVKVADGFAELAGIRVKVGEAPGGEAYICIRPEWIRLSDNGPVRGRVKSSIRTYLGYRAVIDIGGVEITALLDRYVEVGREVSLNVSRVHVIRESA